MRKSNDLVDGQFYQYLKKKNTERNLNKVNKYHIFLCFRLLVG